MLETYISRREVCEKLNVHHDTVRRMERAGRLTGFRLTGRLLRYSLRDVERLMRECRTGAHKPGPRPKQLGSVVTREAMTQAGTR